MKLKEFKKVIFVNAFIKFAASLCVESVAWSSGFCISDRKIIELWSFVVEIVRKLQVNINIYIWNIYSINKWNI